METEPIKLTMEQVKAIQEALTDAFANPNRCICSDEFWGYLEQADILPGEYYQF